MIENILVGVVITVVGGLALYGAISLIKQAGKSIPIPGRDKKWNPKQRKMMESVGWSLDPNNISFVPEYEIARYQTDGWKIVHFGLLRRTITTPQYRGKVCYVMRKKSVRRD